MAKKQNIADAIQRAPCPKKIGRSIEFTVCDGTYTIDGKQLGYVDTLLGAFTAKRATTHLRKVLDDPSVTINHTKVYRQYCQMDLIDFWLESVATSDPDLVAENFLNDRSYEDE